MRCTLNFLWVNNLRSIWVYNSKGESFYMMGKNPMYDFFVGVDEKGEPTQYPADVSDWRTVQ